jgi:8-oxo-dGTP pyrophosphatase MutT (NUDIX family)
MEETTLEIKPEDFIEKFSLQRTHESIEHMFVAKYKGDNDDVEINEEHSDWGWFDINEIKDLDSVPQLHEYIKIAVEKYD